jgi:hypothetical protein
MTDYDKKRREVLELWETLFQVCQDMVSGVKQGNVKLNASLLKEMNQFLKLSIDVIDSAESNDYQETVTAKLYEEMVLPTFDDELKTEM